MTGADAGGRLGPAGADAGGHSSRPDPDERRCDRCGHVWFTGERHHEFVTAGEGPGRPDGVEVLCALCLHQQRLVPTDA